MKTKIHDAPTKDECCYLVFAVLLTCLLYDTRIGCAIDLFGYYTDTSTDLEIQVTHLYLQEGSL